MTFRRVFGKEHRGFILLLVISLVSACNTGIRGGQLYWPDEFWFSRSVQLVSLLRIGDIGQAATLLVRQPIHAGFVPVRSPAVLAAWAVARLLGLGSAVALDPLPTERTPLRARDISMRLIDAEPGP